MKAEVREDCTVYCLQTWHHISFNVGEYRRNQNFLSHSCLKRRILLPVTEDILEGSSVAAIISLDTDSSAESTSWSSSSMIVGTEMILSEAAKEEGKLKGRKEKKYLQSFRAMANIQKIMQNVILL